MAVGGRSPPAAPEQPLDEDESMIRELARLCYDEGILSGSVDPGEMTVDGREVTFRVNERIDKTKVSWLKEHTVTVIFREAARFFPKKLKDDVVRAYEDERTQDGSFEEGSFRRGRVKVESPNVVSYIAKSAAIATWLKNKGQDAITLGSTRYVLEFKPWLTRVQLREQRRRDEESTFWVIAVQVPLDTMFYLEAQIQKAIGPVILAHPPEPDRLKPSLINLKFDLELAARGNMKDKISVITFKGDTLVVNLASSDTPMCRKCKAFFHSEDQCRRNQQQDRSHGPQQSSPVIRGGYQGPLRPRPTHSEDERRRPASPSLSGMDQNHFNPVFSPRLFPGQGGQAQERMIPGGENVNGPSTFMPWISQGMPGLTVPMGGYGLPPGLFGNAQRGDLFGGYSGPNGGGHFIPTTRMGGYQYEDQSIFERWQQEGGIRRGQDERQERGEENRGRVFGNGNSHAAGRQGAEGGRQEEEGGQLDDRRQGNRTPGKQRRLSREGSFASNLRTELSGSSSHSASSQP
ncbi:hypothetical protein CBR_g29686 [Chara braunii]|uniref:Uncharacterized protein n=1 Tax=Chara braunii TaxID=69332 RepID=A0A388LB52_CHABU|nr:hypothetical protein CBR_g29686 [Chara braunii]|eukprot:GBG79539.1 hypothetical protein CBR_g29686 [Chara braunii]